LRVLSLGGHSGDVLGVEFTRDGRSLMTSGRDSLLIVRESDPWE